MCSFVACGDGDIYTRSGDMRLRRFGGAPGALWCLPCGVCVCVCGSQGSVLNWECCVPVNAQAAGP